MEKNERGERLFIPMDIWKCDELSIIEKAVYTKIRVLGKQKKGCIVSNKELIKFLLITERTITTSIANLKNKEVIRTSYRNNERRIKTNEVKFKELPILDIYKGEDGKEMKCVHIPVCVRKNKNLNWSEKAILSWIVSLHTYYGNCYIKNETLARMIQLDKRTVQRTIKKLEEMSLIKVEIRKNDRRRYIILSKKINWV